MDAFFKERNRDLALVSCAHLFASQTIKKKLQCLRIIIGKLWKSMLTTSGARGNLTNWPVIFSLGKNYK